MKDLQNSPSQADRVQPAISPELSAELRQQQAVYQATVFGAILGNPALDKSKRWIPDPTFTYWIEQL